jgi:PKD repeat protein
VTGRSHLTSGLSSAASALGSPLVAKAAVSPLFPGFNGPVPLAPLLTFLNGSATGGMPPYRFAWDFGDGATSALQNATHTYALPGTYAAVLTVTDSGGVTATSTVAAAAIATDGVHWVVARASPSVGSAFVSVHFAVLEMGELPKSYDWAFGDGASANSSESNHTYGRVGTFLARLNVTESDGVNATYRMTVVALSGGPLVALATASVVGLCYSDVWNRVSFQGLVGGGTPPYAFEWHFGEGNATSALQNPTYSYNAPAWSHLANLTVTDAVGLVATSSVSVLVVPGPCPMRTVLPLLAIIVAVVAVASAVGIAMALKRRRLSPPMQPPPPPAPRQ